MPSELGFAWYPQVTETTQDGFTRLRSWVRVPQRPPNSSEKARGPRGNGTKPPRGGGGLAGPAGVGLRRESRAFALPPTEAPWGMCDDGHSDLPSIAVFARTNVGDGGAAWMKQFQ